jgi:hypothetical protein
MKYLVNVRPTAGLPATRDSWERLRSYAENFVFDAESDAEAYQELLKLFQPQDRRRLPASRT